MAAWHDGLRVAEGAQPASAGWHGHLQLDYRRRGERTIALDRHHGPLRVLQRLYPEGDAICHQVLVHPPGGIVGGDVLALHATLAPGSHALITTPGATKFYRSAGPLAVQRVHADLAPGARLEWLPLETIAYNRCNAQNCLRFTLAPGAQMMGWDVLALGLPAAGQPFVDGCFEQQLALPGVWLSRAALPGMTACCWTPHSAWPATRCWPRCGWPRRRGKPWAASAARP